MGVVTLWKPGSDTEQYRGKAMLPWNIRSGAYEVHAATDHGSVLSGHGYVMLVTRRPGYRGSCWVEATFPDTQEGIAEAVQALEEVAKTTQP